MIYKGKCLHLFSKVVSCITTNLYALVSGRHIRQNAEIKNKYNLFFFYKNPVLKHSKIKHAMVYIDQNN